MHNNFVLFHLDLQFYLLINVTNYIFVLHIKKKKKISHRNEFPRNEKEKLMSISVGVFFRRR